ncbi:hypothetical protein [Citrobacter meridianamericanus]|uniref:Uncharacterized protein n=1 Tax=Citrobacter meridianamericanus TaxID=2894201 RepID=A0ABT1BFF1_9ENTR|nr:hypothetical protein [Citrobacter meridianamericanus]MCO5784600.1 hypothetical protein [Citrobacter meridianamericanus]
MSAEYGNSEDGGLLSSVDVPVMERTEARGRFTAVPVLTALPLADFARRVRSCDSPRRLDMLHTLMLRSVPVGQRAGYIALLNQRDEELSWQNSGTAWEA